MTEPDLSLYNRLGGYDVIAKVIDDMFVALRADPSFARFGAGRSIDSHNCARQLPSTRSASSAADRACTSPAT